jgi:sensor histidine kinase YesM
MRYLSTNILQIRFIALAFCLGLVQFAVLWWNHFPDDDAFFDGLHTFFTISLCGLVLRVIQFNYHTKHSITFSKFGLIATLSLIIHYSSLFLLRNVLSNDYYREYVYNIQGVRYVFNLIILIAVSLFWWIAKNAQTQHKVQEQILEQERALARAELVNINNQLQPHFLFNSLNSISALSMIDPKEANRMIHLLSDFLRGTLRKDFEKLVSFKDELNQANLYLEIEKIRFGNRLSVQTAIDDTAINANLPALIIQPLVENALKHGLNNSDDQVNIEITAKSDNKQLTITIINPYESEHISQFKGTGYGIQSVQKRLQLFFGRNDCLSIERENNEFKVILRIPQKA